MTKAEAWSLLLQALGWFSGGAALTIGAAAFFSKLMADHSIERHKAELGWETEKLKGELANVYVYVFVDETHGSVGQVPHIPTEMQNNGLAVRKLGDFGKVDSYNCWPSNLKRDRPALLGQDFLHPVLDEQKYVSSSLRYGSLHSYFLRDGQLRRLLGPSSSSPLSMMPAFLIETIRRIRLYAPSLLTNSRQRGPSIH